MRSLASSFRCAQPRRSSDTDDIASWARSVVADPAAHAATPREAAIVGSLLVEMEAGR